MASWNALIAEDAERRLEKSSAADDGYLMVSGLKTAGKCRDCSKTIDIGTRAWFNKEGEPGKKITCQECHQLKEAAGSQGAAEQPGANDEEAPKPKRKVAEKAKAPKITPELLLDKQKGVISVYRTFPTFSFKRKKGGEAADLKKLLAKYEEWAHSLVPGMAFSDFATRLGKDYSGNHKVRYRVDFIRNVQQGLCELDDLDDYELAERGDGIVGVVNEDGTTTYVDVDGQEVAAPHGLHAEAPASAATGAQLSEEQRLRIEQKRREALERAAARQRSQPSEEPDADAAQAAAAATAGEEDDEAEWNAMMPDAPAAAREVSLDDDEYHDEYPNDEDLFDADEAAADEMLGSAAYYEMSPTRPAVEAEAPECERAAAEARAAAAAQAEAIAAGDLDDLDLDEL